MELVEKMSCRTDGKCRELTDCCGDVDRHYGESLFDKDWEVFVIKRNDESGRFDWFTLCCESESKAFRDNN